MSSVVDTEIGLVAATARYNLLCVIVGLFVICHFRLDLACNLRVVGPHDMGLLGGTGDGFVKNYKLSCLWRDLFGCLIFLLEFVLTCQIHVLEVLIGLIALNRVNSVIVKFQFLRNLLEVFESLETFIIVGRVETIQS